MSFAVSYAWFDVGDGRQVYRRVPQETGKRSDLPVPMIITDHMDAVVHPCDGQTYESKSAFRRVTKANGYTEVGNDPARNVPKPKAEPDRKAIRDAVRKAANRVKNG